VRIENLDRDEDKEKLHEVEEKQRARHEEHPVPVVRPSNRAAWWLFCEVDSFARVVFPMGGLGGLDLDKVGAHAERWHGWQMPDPDTVMRLAVMSDELLRIHLERSTPEETEE
jgi:hypothetical protein